MPDNAILEILHAIRTDLTAVRSDQSILRTDLDAIKADLAEKGVVLVALSADMDGVKADMGAVKADLAEKGVLLVALRTDVDAVKADLAEKGVVLTALRTDVAAIADEIHSWPDLHFLQAAAVQQFRDASEAREQRRYIEIRLDEIYSSMATGPEITGLRSDVTTSIDRQRELDLRISTIESHLGIGNPLGAGNPLAPE
jgi:hypothetical protein